LPPRAHQAFPGRAGRRVYLPFTERNLGDDG
jgi:hypothetical protein